MKSIVSKLCDSSRLTVPEELTQWRIGPDALEKQLEMLAAASAEEFQPDTVQTGDSVRLSCPGRTDVLLFPGLALPGAEEAEKAVVGHSVADTLTAPIGGTLRTMTVREIRRRVPAAINDALAQAQGIEGVTTLDAYRRWYQAKAEEQNKSGAAKEIAFYLLEQIRDGSEYSLDQEEMREWIDTQARQRFEDSIAMGEDPHIPDEGFELLTDEQAIDRIKAELVPEFKMILTGQAICEQAGIPITWEDLRGEFEQLMPPEQEGVTEEEREEAKAMFMESTPITKAFEVLCQEAEQYLED